MTPSGEEETLLAPGLTYPTAKSWVLDEVTPKKPIVAPEVWGVHAMPSGEVAM